MMLKKIAILTLVLAVSSVASATTPGYLPGSIVQGQNFIVGGTGASTGIGTVINLVHGDAMASSFQTLEVGNVQSAPCDASPCPSPFDWICQADICEAEAVQTQDAYLKQDGNAEGSCGIITVNAFLDAAGVQEQGISNATDPKYQLQELGIAADQILARSSGSGMAESTNIASLGQEQAGANPAGSVYEATAIGAFQDGYTTGAANSTVTMANTLVASTSQGQQVY